MLQQTLHFAQAAVQSKKIRINPTIPIALHALKAILIEQSRTRTANPSLYIYENSET